MKKRPPRKQLIEAGKIARDILAERKIILPPHSSAIDKIQSTRGTPILPGIPSYVPYPWTINNVRRILYDLGRAWQKEIKDDDSRKSRGIGFFKFVLEGMNRPKSTISKLMIKTVKTSSFEQKYLSRNETIGAIKKFLVDSFAVSVITKTHTDVANFFEWFLRWTDDLLNLWPDHLRNIDAKRKDSKNSNPP